MKDLLLRISSSLKPSGRLESPHDLQVFQSYRKKLENDSIV